MPSVHSRQCDSSVEAVRGFYPPPGLTKGEVFDVALSPDFKRPCDFQPGALLKMLSSPTDVPNCILNSQGYPWKPPGVFECDRSGYESTAASTPESEMGDERDTAVPDANKMPDLVNMAEPVGEVGAGCKKFFHEMQVVPLGEVDGKPCSVLWHVTEKKLKSKDKQIVSQSFEVSPGCRFRLFLSKGLGSVELKCMEGASSAPALSFKLSIGAGAASAPIEHNFKERTVCALPKQEGHFDFASAIDEETKTLLVSLEAVPARAPGAGENSCL
jgi:hypothetical protein